MNKTDHLLKLVLNGQVINLYCDHSTLDEVTSHPKFVKMSDGANDIFVSMEDILAFEIASNRKQPDKQTENDGISKTEEGSPQQA